MGRRGGTSRSTSSRSTSSHHGSKPRTNHASAAKIVKQNHSKGIAFEKRATSAVKHSAGIQSRSVKTQVSTKSHGRADIVAKTKSGQKVVIEAKNYRGNPVTKDNVKQVRAYARDLHAKPVLLVSKTTTVPASTKKYAAQGKMPVSIGKL